MFSSLMSFITNFAAGGCTPPGSGLLGLPTWYKYLPGRSVTDVLGGGTSSTTCAPQLTSIGDVWLVGAAILELLLRIAALGAICIVIWGGIKYVTSSGDSNKITEARNTITDGLAGLIIAVSATAVITFVAGRF